MKSKILNKLAEIKQLAEKTGIEGKLTLRFSGCTMQEWDNAIDSITEYPRYNHFVDVTSNLNVSLLLD